MFLKNFFAFFAPLPPAVVSRHFFTLYSSPFTLHPLLFTLYSSLFTLHSLLLYNLQQGVVSPLRRRVTASLQAPYRSLPPGGESSLIPLLVLSPRDPLRWARVGAPTGNRRGQGGHIGPPLRILTNGADGRKHLIRHGLRPYHLPPKGKVRRVQEATPYGEETGAISPPVSLRSTAPSSEGAKGKSLPLMREVAGRRPDGGRDRAHHVRPYIAAGQVAPSSGPAGHLPPCGGKVRRVQEAAPYTVHISAGKNSQFSPRPLDKPALR